MIALASKFWVLAIGGVGLWATSTHAQNDGPVAIRPMVTAPCDDAWESASEYVLGE
jgi:hypothetical protein